MGEQVLAGVIEVGVVTGGVVRLQTHSGGYVEGLKGPELAMSMQVDVGKISSTQRMMRALLVESCVVLSGNGFEGCSCLRGQGVPQHGAQLGPGAHGTVGSFQS